MADNRANDKEQVSRERWHLLDQVSELLDTPMIVISIIWLILVIVEMTQGLPGALNQVMIWIWGLFVLHFLLEWFLAPAKWAYLRGNWFTAVALFVPAFRMLRIFRGLRFLRLAKAARVSRGASLLRILSSLNRSIQSARVALHRHRTGYVLVATLIVVFGGAAGGYFFENPSSLRAAGVEGGGDLDSFGEALWWSMALVTNLGPVYIPQTAEGRLLAAGLSLYALSILGYVAATFAAYFMGRPSEGAGTEVSNEDIARQIAALRAELGRR